MREQRVRKGFLLLLVVAATAAFLWILQSFLITLLMAAVFSGLVYPFYARLTVRLGGRKHAAAGLTLLLVLLLVVLPLSAILTIVVNQAVRITGAVQPVVQRLINEPDYMAEQLQRLPGAERLMPYRDQIITRAGAAANSVGAYLLNWVSATTRGTVTVLVDFVLLLYSMYFLLIDGPKMLAAMLHHIPLADRDKHRMQERFVSITRATIKGTIVIGLIQGATAGLAFWVVGIPDALFWTVVMMLLSILPVVGGALVWVPACVYLALTGHVMQGALLAAFCALVVGSIDNVLRPRLVGRDTKMHDLMILFSTLGGLTVFGPLGFILGPIVAGLFVTSWAIFGAAFRDVLGEERQG